MPVAARQEILDAISELTTDSPLNIDGATEDAAGYVRLKKLTGIENTLPTEIGVTARISEKQIECTLRRLPIQADGLDDSLTATLSTGSTTAQLTGGYAFIEGADRGGRAFVCGRIRSDGRRIYPARADPYR